MEGSPCDSNPMYIGSSCERSIFLSIFLGILFFRKLTGLLYGPLAMHNKRICGEANEMHFTLFNHGQLVKVIGFDEFP